MSSWTDFFNRAEKTDAEDLLSRKIVTELGASARKQVSDYPVLSQYRAESLILHGCMERSLSPVHYNLILHVRGSDQLFSLFRSDVLEEAETEFINFRESIVPLIKIDNKICNKSQLDEICAIIRKNPGWNAAHLAAALDLFSYLKHPDMQKLINTKEGPDAKTPLLVAVEYEKVYAINTLLNLKAEIDGIDLNGNNVIHTAVSKPDCSPDILKNLLRETEANSELLVLKDSVNNLGCTPLYIAMQQNAIDLVTILLKSGVNVNIAGNEAFPIHLAVKNKWEETIKEINKIGINQMSLKDLKDGGTPLHWADDATMVKLLLDLGCDPNIVNNRGQSALHSMARKEDLRAVLLLLGHQCFPDLQDENGDTALHIASQLCSKSIMKALMVFNADVNIANNMGHTPRHLLCTTRTGDDADEALFLLCRVGALRCSVSQSCTSGCTSTANSAASFNGKAPANCPLNSFESDRMSHVLSVFSALGLENRNPTSKKNFASKKPKIRSESPGADQTLGGRLLCLDGGGIRGLVLTQILLCIQNYVGEKISTLFDWISGTSTGGILGLGLACGKSVLELQCLYMRLKDEIFTGSKPYSSTVIEEFLKKEFGEFYKMSEIHRPRVMITTTLVDTRPAEFHFFRNYKSPSSILNQFTEEDPGMNEFVWQVAKWTGAAPSFFKLDGSRYIDGGLVSNNPTLDALSELVQLNAAMKAVGDYSCEHIQIPSCVVSLGCGIQPQVPVNPQHMDISVPSGIFDTISIFSKLPAFVSMLVDQATLSEGQVVERSRAWCSSIGVPFFRFSPQCPVFVDLDETNDEILVDLMWVTRAYLYANNDKLSELKNILLENAPCFESCFE